MQKKQLFYWILIPFIALTITIVSIHPVILRSYAEFFTVNNYHKGADAVLILGGSADTRAKKSIELLHNGFIDEILITHPRPPIKEYENIFVSDFENLKQILEYEKVNYTIVEDINDGAKSTFDEARDLILFLEDNPLERVIIVTDNFHTRRAKYAFDKIFEKSDCKTIIEIAGAPNQIYDEKNWWKTERGLNAYVSEGFKYLIYLVIDNDIEGIETE